MKEKCNSSTKRKYTIQELELTKKYNVRFNVEKEVCNMKDVECHPPLHFAMINFTSIFLQTSPLGDMYAFKISNLRSTLKLIFRVRMIVRLDSRLQGSMLHIVIVKTKLVTFLLILNYHVCFRYQSYIFFLHKSSRATNYGKASF